MSSQEASARALLLDMQTKLAVSPHTALGLPTHATAADIRSAFLQLTKTFHPARFGRMTTEIQRLSNEVFLALRAAHDQIAKPAAAAVKPSGRTASTTGIPLTKQPATTRPFGVPVTPTTPPNPTRVPTTKMAALDPHRSTQPMPTTVKTSVPPATAPTGPAVRPTPGPTLARPPVAAPAASGPTSAKTPAPQVTRPGQPGGTIRFPTLKQPATAAAPAAPSKPTASSSQGAALDPELALILQLMGMGQWDAAQAAIDALAAKAPQNKRYAALACYSRGRRAQLEGNLRIAQIELNDALKLDPDLDVAKTAFAELYARRK